MWIGLAIALSGLQTYPAGRVYSSATLHVGIRPAVLISSEETAAGFTIQLSF